MTKKLICLVLAVLMTLSLAACAKTTETTPPPESQAPAQEQTQPATDSGDAEPAAPAGYDTHLTIKMNVLDAEKTGNTERDAWFNEKFNVSWDLGRLDGRGSRLGGR